MPIVYVCVVFSVRFKSHLSLPFHYHDLEKVTIFFFQSADSKVPWITWTLSGCWTTQLSLWRYLNSNPAVKCQLQMREAKRT